MYVVMHVVAMLFNGTFHTRRISETHASLHASLHHYTWLVWKHIWRNFRNGIAIVDMCHQLSSRKVDAQKEINWIVGRSPKLTIPSSSDARPLLLIASSKSISDS